MITEKLIPRKFVVKVNNKETEIDDPNPDMTIEEVRKYLSGIYPEVINSGIPVPDIIKGNSVYKFSTSIGIKG